MDSIRGGRVFVVGVTSQIGASLGIALKSHGIQFAGSSRSLQQSDVCSIHLFDHKEQLLNPQADSVDAIIALSPLSTIEFTLRIAELLGARRLIAYGSTGVFSKSGSTNLLDREFVREQLDAEKLLAQRATQLSILWTLFRPTMIYGAGTDQNVTFIRSMIRRFRAFPIPFGAKGRRQPVHVEDLADACVKVLNNPATFNRAYNLGGGEVIEYAEMVRRICRADRLPARLIPIPSMLYRWIVRLARRMPGLAYLNEAMVDRMFTDLTTDHSEAARAFGYAPRKFQPPGRVVPEN